MKRWTVAVIALAALCAAPALAEQQQQQQAEQQQPPQQYQKAVPLIATPDMVPFGPGRDRPPLADGGSAWTPGDRFGNWPSSSSSFPQQQQQQRPGFDGLSKDFDPLFSRPVLPAWRQGQGFNNNNGFGGRRPWGVPPLSQEAGGAWRRGFLGSGVPVRDLDWATGVTADGKEFDVPLPTSSGQGQGRRRGGDGAGAGNGPVARPAVAAANKQQQQEPLPQQQQQSNDNKNNNINRQQQRPQITGFVLGLKNGTTLRVPRPERRWPPQQLQRPFGGEVASPASFGGAGNNKQQKQRPASTWQGLQDPPRINLMSDRLQEMRARMDALLQSSGGAARPAFGGADVAEAAPTRPLTEPQADELPQPQQPEEDRIEVPVKQQPQQVQEAVSKP